MRQKYPETILAHSRSHFHFKMTDGQRKKHKADHDVSASLTSQGHTRWARMEPSMESSPCMPTMINSSRRTLQELIDERHQMNPDNQDAARIPDAARDYPDIRDEDRPTAMIDDMFIPEPDQIRTTWSQWDDNMTHTDEVWLQDPNQRHCTRWSGHW